MRGLYLQGRSIVFFQHLLEVPLPLLINLVCFCLLTGGVACNSVRSVRSGICDLYQLYNGRAAARFPNNHNIVWRLYRPYGNR